MQPLIEPQTARLLGIAAALLVIVLFCGVGIALMRHQLKKTNQQDQLKVSNILIALPPFAFALFAPIIIGVRLQQYWHYAPITGLITGLLLMYIGGGWLVRFLDRRQQRAVNKTAPATENRSREQKD